MPRPQCVACARATSTPRNFLLVCSCGRAWHHRCTKPPVEHSALLAMIRACNREMHEGSLDAWRCPECVVGPAKASGSRDGARSTAAGERSTRRPRSVSPIGLSQQSPSTAVWPPIRKKKRLQHARPETSTSNEQQIPSKRAMPPPMRQSSRPVSRARAFPLPSPYPPPRQVPLQKLPLVPPQTPLRAPSSSPFIASLLLSRTVSSPEATSRRPIHERTFPNTPLSVPAPARVPPLVDLQQVLRRNRIRRSTSSRLDDGPPMKRRKTGELNYETEGSSDNMNGVGSEQRSMLESLPPPSSPRLRAHQYRAESKQSQKLAPVRHPAVGLEAPSTDPDSEVDLGPKSLPEAECAEKNSVVPKDPPESDPPEMQPTVELKRPDAPEDTESSATPSQRADKTVTASPPIITQQEHQVTTSGDQGPEAGVDIHRSPSHTERSDKNSTAFSLEVAQTERQIPIKYSSASVVQNAPDMQSSPSPQDEPSPSQKNTQPDSPDSTEIPPTLRMGDVGIQPSPTRQEEHSPSPLGSKIIAPSLSFSTEFPQLISEAAKTVAEPEVQSATVPASQPEILKETPSVPISPDLEVSNHLAPRGVAKQTEVADEVSAASPTTENIPTTPHPIAALPGDEISTDSDLSAKVPMLEVAPEAGPSLISPSTTDTDKPHLESEPSETTSDLQKGDHLLARSRLLPPEASLPTPRASSPRELTNRKLPQPARSKPQVPVLARWFSGFAMEQPRRTGPRGRSKGVAQMRAEGTEFSFVARINSQH